MYKNYAYICFRCVFSLSFFIFFRKQLEVKMAKQCEVACVKKLKKTEKDAFVRAIEDDYRY